VLTFLLVGAATISGQALVLSDSEDLENANISFTTADYFRKVSLKARRRMEPPTSSDSSDVDLNLTNCSRDENPYYVPVTQEDEPLRSYVRESDEWMHLFRSMGSYKNVLPVRFIKEVMKRHGCTCEDRYTLKFAGYLADVFTYQLVDSITDWAYLRLEGEEEEKVELDPKYKRQSVKKMFRNMNFTLKEIDILHAMSELLPEFEQIIQKIPLHLEQYQKESRQSSEEEIDDEDDDEEKDEEKSQDELHRSVDFASGSRDTLDLDAIVVPNETKTVHVDPEAVQEMTSFSKRMFPSRKAKPKEESSSMELSKAEGSKPSEGGSDEGEDDKQIQEEGMQDQREEDSSSSYIDRLVEANLPDLDFTPLLDTDPDAHVDGYYPVTKYISDSVEDVEMVSAVGTEYQAEVLGSNAANYAPVGGGVPSGGFPSQPVPMSAAYPGSNQPYYPPPGYQIRRPGTVPTPQYSYGNPPQYATYPGRPLAPNPVPGAYPQQAYPLRVPAMPQYPPQGYRGVNSPSPPMYSQQQYPQTFPAIVPQVRYGMPSPQPPVGPGQRMAPMPPGPASGMGQGPGSPQAGRPPGVPPGYPNYGNKPS